MSSAFPPPADPLAQRAPLMHSAAQQAAATAPSLHHTISRESTASLNSPTVNGRSGPEWLAQTADALGQPRSQQQQTQQSQQTQAAAAASDSASTSLNRSKHSAGDDTTIGLSSPRSLAVLSSSAPSSPPLSLSSSSAASTPLPFFLSVKTNDTPLKCSLDTPLKQHGHEGATGQRDAAAHTPPSAAAQINGTAATGAAASAHKPQSASLSTPSSALSSSAAVASLPRPPHSPSVASAPAVWDGVTCDGCGQSPIIGVRFHCVICADISDLCAECVAKGFHTEEHSMQRCAIPAKQQLQPVQRKSAPRSIVDATAGAAAQSTPSPLHAPFTAAAGHLHSMPDADESTVARPRLPDSSRRDEESDEDPFEGPEPASSDDSPSGGDDDALMDDAAAEGNQPSKTAVSSASSHTRKSANGEASSLHCRRRHSRGVQHRSLPDFYVEPLSGERMRRPTRKSTETSPQFRARYKRWHNRGTAVWMPADIEQANQQRKKQQAAQALAASSSSAAASGAGASAPSSRRPPAGSVVKECDQAGSDSSSTEDDDSDGGGGSDSSSDSDYIPPRPTLVECRDNLVRFEVRLAEWKARYGDRSDAEQEEDSLARDQRRTRARGKESTAERSDEEEETAAASPSSRRPRPIAGRVPSNADVLPSKNAHFTKPHFYVDQFGKRINRPTRKPEETQAKYKRRYVRWLNAGKAVWTNKELDTARRASLRTLVGDDDDDDDAELDEGPVLGSAPPSSALNLARSGRTLPDSFVDPETGKVRRRPVRADFESEVAFLSSYDPWRRRGWAIPAPEFLMARANRRSQSAAFSAAAAPSAAASSSPPQLPPSNSPPDMTSLLSQVLARLIASEAAVGGAVTPLISQLQAPAHAAAAAASAPPHIPLPPSSAAAAAMRDDEESDNADVSSHPALDGLHSSAAQSSPLQRICQSAPTGVSAASAHDVAPRAHAAAASSAAKGKRKANSDERSAQADGAVVMSAAAAAAASSSGSPDPASKKPRSTAIPTGRPITLASAVTANGHPRSPHNPQASASSSASPDVGSAIWARLAATSTLSLILAECISDPAKRAECLAAFTDGDITLARLERDFAFYFPDGRKSRLVDYGLITGGPCLRLEAIIRERIKLKEREECMEIKREDRAAGK